jgi:lipoprotein-releasing system permease protein
MYKLLLCLCYLRTRFIAIASVLSVALGVWVMIITNSVMAGFSHEMQSRIKGIVCDVVFESRSMEGMCDAQWHMNEIRKVTGDSIQGMTPVVVVPAMLSYQWGGSWVTQQVQMIGIDAETQGKVSEFGNYLQHPANREQMSFTLRDDARDGPYDTRDHQSDTGAPERVQMRTAGWQHRREMAQVMAEQERNIRSNTPVQGPEDPFKKREAQKPVKTFDMAKEQNTGVVMGIAMSSYRTLKGEDRFRVLPGDDIKLSFPTAGVPPKVVSDTYTVVDFYESRMAEYDSQFVFAPIHEVQELRGMFDPVTHIGYVNAIEIKLKPGADGDVVRDKLRKVFDPGRYQIGTWRDKQSALLGAVTMETTILNILLFAIIAVAGFGILAIFYMIVVEKTRDIGVLKSLGASGAGIMQIFLSYGLALGLVGSGIGLVSGLLFVHYINNVADAISYITGHPAFNPEIYYFYKIPTIVSPLTVSLIILGALGIAVSSSVLPACRAALLHPVEALRYE